MMKRSARARGGALPAITSVPLAERLIRLFFWAYTVIFGMIWIGALFNVDGNVLSGVPILGLFVLVFYLGLWMLLIPWIGKRIAFLERNRIWILWGVTAACFAAYLVFAFVFEFRGTDEIYFVYDAAEWLSLGPDKNLYTFRAGEYITYFAQFNNVENTMLYLLSIFRVFRLMGLASMRHAGMVYFCLKTALVLPLLFATARRRFGIRPAYYAMLLFVSALPILVSSPVVYHYTGTFAYPLLVLFLYTVLEQSQRRPVRLLCAAGIALVTAVGTFVMPAVIVPLIAVAIDAFLRKPARIRRAVLGAAAVTAALLLGFHAGADAFAQEHYYDAEVMEKEAYPFEAWVYVGLNEEVVGFYNDADRSVYSGLSSVGERKTVLREAIAERIRSYGPLKLTWLMYQKASAEFGSGTLYSDYPLRRKPINNNPLLPYFSSKTPTVEPYRAVAQGVHLAILLFAFLGAIRQRNMAGKPDAKEDPKAFAAPWIAVFGLLLATLLYETNPRHVYNFLPVLILCASSGVDDARAFLSRFMQCCRACPAPEETPEK